ncbi:MULTISPECIES: thymidylate synthase [unclassified Lysinibacillus]|uniref:thymidylate synthase n=1 Tax=unclassified Lysinibacillus TaxID=2636778 RepID=UPI00382FB261
MYFEGESFDQLYVEICNEIMNQGKNISPRGLETKEILGVILKLKRPRSRILNNPTRKFSLSYAFAEWLWIMKKTNKLDMIQFYAPSYHKYSDNGETLHGAYGPRIGDAIQKVIRLLQEDPNSRRALIPIYSKNDVGMNSKDIPCTSSLQFFIRENKLDLFVHMRSNDVYLGLPYDVFTFTMIQEYVAKILNIELGIYTHMVNSLHVYENQYEKIRKICLYNEKEVKEMEIMPKELINNQLKYLIFAEEMLRFGEIVDIEKLNDYFKSLFNYLIDYYNKLNKQEGVTT